MTVSANNTENTTRLAVEALGVGASCAGGCLRTQKTDRPFLVNNSSGGKAYG
jgi:hypothetical protein